MSPRPSIRSAVAARSNLWLGLGAAVLTAGSLLTGWWLGQRSLAGAGADRSRLELRRQADALRARVERGTAAAGDDQRLLQLLLALDEKDEATTLLERLADQQPERWALRLMLAELRRSSNDRPGAEREVRQLLNQRPDRLEALQLMALLQLEQGRGAEAERQLDAVYRQAAKRPQNRQALAIALVLGDLRQRRGDIARADELYRKLAAEFPDDARPVLARALLLRQQGRIREALDQLDEARQRKPDQRDPRLDEVAAAWGLAPLRQAVNGPKGPSPRPEPKPAAAPDP